MSNTPFKKTKNDPENTAEGTPKKDQIDLKPFGGNKFDEDKLRWHLLPIDVLQEVIKVLEYGVRKYEQFNWVTLDKERYYNAMQRHMFAFAKGEKIDSESGLPHIAHAHCNMMFIHYLELVNPEEPLIKLYAEAEKQAKLAFNRRTKSKDSTVEKSDS